MLEGQSQGPDIQLNYDFQQRLVDFFSGKGGKGWVGGETNADEWEGGGPKSADILCRQHLTYNFGFSNTI